MTLDHQKISFGRKKNSVEKDLRLFELLLSDRRVVSTNSKDEPEKVSVKKVVKKCDAKFSKHAENIQKNLRPKNHILHEKLNFGEYSELVNGKNRLLDRKLSKEIRYYEKEVDTYCRLLTDKQRSVKYRHEKMFPEIQVNKHQRTTTTRQTVHRSLSAGW